MLQNMTQDPKFSPEFLFAYVDKAVDPKLASGFDIRATPQLVVIDNSTAMAYSWDFRANASMVGEWLLSKSYLKSSY